METKQMIEVMQAFEDGKKIESSFIGEDDWRLLEYVPEWAWDLCVYRVAPESEQKKEGRWERVEIREDDGQYCLIHPVADIYVIDALPRIPGFGGIEYQSPFDPKVIVRSMVPLCFSSDGDWTFITDEHDRPGIPVAAWFWREEK